MDSQITSILAAIVLHNLMGKIISRLRFKLTFLYKYVDDIICTVTTYKTHNTLKISNSVNIILQFTLE